MIAEGVATAEEVQAVISEYDKICEDALAKAQDVTVLDNSHWLDSRWKGFFKKDAKLGVHPVTGVPREMLQTISDAISTPPKGEYNKIYQNNRWNIGIFSAIFKFSKAEKKTKIDFYDT